LGAEARDVVDAEVAEEPERVRPAHEQVGHVMGLIEQRTGLPPGLLLRAPVAELRRDGERVGPCRGVPQQVDRAADTRERCVEALAVRRTLPAPLEVEDCRAAVTLAMCLRIARSAARGSPAAIASAIARCSEKDLSDRPGERIVRYWKRTICAW